MKQTNQRPRLMGGEAGLASSIRQTNEAFAGSVDVMAKTCGHSMTGFAIVTWDTQGRAMVQTHYSIHSGIEPGDAPAMLSGVLEESNILAAMEARHGARA